MARSEIAKKAQAKYMKTAKGKAALARASKRFYKNHPGKAKEWRDRWRAKRKAALAETDVVTPPVKVEKSSKQVADAINFEDL